MTPPGHTQNFQTKPTCFDLFQLFEKEVNGKLPIMDRCSNRRGKSQRREGKAKEDQRRGKGIKYAKDGLFSNILRLRKVGSLKQPVRSHVAG